jgi:hypothetical protein
MSQADEREAIRQHSGWLIPVLFFFVILLLSGLFLGWDLRPGPRPASSPTGQSTLVRLSIRGVGFAIPANYIPNSAGRAGGERESVALAALFPSWQGYSQAQAGLFAGNAPDRPVIRLLLHGDADPLTPAARLNRIYRPYIQEPMGMRALFGLTRYSFAPQSGYEHNELFAGQDNKGLVLFLCEQPSAELPSPNCLAPDRPLKGAVSYSYRFKRAYLARWRDLSAGADRLVRRFESG